jgi:hypothetical protein
MTLPNGKTLTILWHDGEFCNEVPRPPMLEEGRELGNKIIPGQWNAGAVVYGSKHALKYGSHGADGCRVIPEKEMRELIKDIRERRKTKPNFWMTQIGSHFEDFTTASRSAANPAIPSRPPASWPRTRRSARSRCATPTSGWSGTARTSASRNCDAANAFVEPHYRKGYALKV